MWSLFDPGLADYWTARNWLAEPMNATLMTLTLVAVLYHSQLGMAVIVEDYSGGAIRVALLIGLQLLHIALGVAGIFAIIRVAAEGRV